MTTPPSLPGSGASPASHRAATVKTEGQRARRRLFARGPWEMAASVLIGTGVVMLMQPFFLWAYTWSFLVTLTGTVLFIIVSHFPE